MSDDRKNWEGFAKDTENVLGDKFWDDFQKIMPKKTPLIDILEDEDNGYIIIELPGLKSKDAVKASFHGQNLVIEGNVPQTFSSGNINVLHSERYIGYFKRSIIVPFSFLPQKIHANYENGILKIVVPKTKKNFNVPFTISQNGG